MKFKDLLIAAMRLEVFSLISRKLLTRSGTAMSCLNWNKMASLAIYVIFDLAFYITEEKE